MIALISFLFILVISFIYGVYFSDPMLGNTLVIHYLLGGVIINALVRKNFTNLTKWYSLFFILYSIYLFFVQIGLNKFYGNNDEVLFFASSKDAINYGWDKIVKITFYKGFYSEYPAAMLLWSAITKLGHEIGVEKLRLYSRFHLLIMGSGIMAILCSYMEALNYDKRRTIIYALVFGLCTYIVYLTCNYTRDLHCMFFMTIIGYKVMTSSNITVLCELLLLSFILVFFRKENGLFAFLFIGAWIYMNGYVSKKTVVIFGVFCFLLAVSTILLVYSQSSEWTDSHTGSGLFTQINSLPIYLKPIAYTLFMLFQPFPFYNMMGDGHSGGLLALPMMFLPVIIMYVFWLLYKSYRIDKNRDFFLFLIFVGYFILVSFLAPVYRRVFLIMPSAFLLFLKRQDLVDKWIKLKALKYILMFWGVVNIMYILFDLLRKS